MDRVKILEKKIHQVAERLTSVQEEKKKLTAELKYFEGETKHAGSLIRENEKLKEKNETVAKHIGKLLKKLS